MQTGGRPRKIISESYEKLAKLRCRDDPEGRTCGELLAAGQFQAAIKGDTRAAREITDRLDGKPVQAIFGGDGNPITIELLDRFLEEADQEDGECSLPPAIFWAFIRMKA